MRPSIAIAVVLSVALSAPAFAGRASKQEVVKKEKRLEDVKKQIREEKKGVKAVAEKETGILGELDSINKNLTEKRDELKIIEARLALVQRDINAANSKIDRVERKRKVLAERLKSRLRAMYRMKRGEALSVLFSSEAGAIGRKHKYLTMIMDSDSNLISDYEESISELSSERQKLGGLYKDVASARADAVRKKGEAESLQRSKVALLTDVKHEKERRLKVIKELEDAAAELSDLLNRLGAEEQAASAQPEPAGTGFAAMKGRLRMPVEGNIVSAYGKVKHPKFNTVTFNNGIEIEASSGAAVRSVYDGRVIYTGWLKGYGQVMIIDHKGGFYTLFAHLSKVMKDRGEEVKRDEEVAVVGDTGPSSSTGLYFEIRQHGIPRDPTPWLAEK